MQPDDEAIVQRVQPLILGRHLVGRHNQRFQRNLDPFASILEEMLIDDGEQIVQNGRT